MRGARPLPVNELWCCSSYLPWRFPERSDVFTGVDFDVVATVGLSVRLAQILRNLANLEDTRPWRNTTGCFGIKLPRGWRCLAWRRIRRRNEERKETSLGGVGGWGGVAVVPPLHIILGTVVARRGACRRATMPEHCAARNGRRRLGGVLWRMESTSGARGKEEDERIRGGGGGGRGARFLSRPRLVFPACTGRRRRAASAPARCPLGRRGSRADAASATGGCR